MDIKKRLRQLDKSTSPAPATRRQKPGRSLHELAEHFGGEVLSRKGHELIISRHAVALQSQHGRTQLQAIEMSGGHLLKLASRNRVSADFSLHQALFVDTETTGLAGGAGTYVFLLGLGFIENDEFIVEQIFLPTLTAEPALLDLLQERLENRRGIVSFNGKSYDIPLLTTRFIQNRLRPEIDLHQHFDVLHAARRLWQRDFGDCSLTTLEHHICGISRNGDIPGEAIPGIYADFLRTGHSGQLRKVFYHNRMDIITLLGLSIEIARRYHEATATQKISVTELERIGRLFLEMRAPEKAAELFSALLQQTGLPEQSRRTWLLHYAQSQKSMRNHDDARKAWQQVLEEHGFSFEASIELAKLFEHKMSDPALALEMTERALRVLETRMALHPKQNDRQLLTELRHRKNRLLRKLNA